MFVLSFLLSWEPIMIKKKDISIADCKKTGTFLSLYLLLNYCGVVWIIVYDCACVSVRECVHVWRTLNTLFHQVWSSFFSLWWDLESNWGVRFMFEHTGTEEKEAELVVEETDAGNCSPAGNLRGGRFNHGPSSSVCFLWDSTHPRGCRSIPDVDGENTAEPFKIKPG